MNENILSQKLLKFKKSHWEHYHVNRSLNSVTCWYHNKEWFSGVLNFAFFLCFSVLIITRTANFNPTRQYIHSSTVGATAKSPVKFRSSHIANLQWIWFNDWSNTSRPRPVKFHSVPSLAGFSHSDTPVSSIVQIQWTGTSKAIVTQG